MFSDFLIITKNRKTPFLSNYSELGEFIVEFVFIKEGGERMCIVLFKMVCDCVDEISAGFVEFQFHVLTKISLIIFR